MTLPDLPVDTPRPRVGVGVLVVRDGLVLLGERLGAHGARSWAPPGGHLEFGESVEACATRELAEETGLVAEAVHAGPWMSSHFPEVGRHYITLFVVCHAAAGEPVRREPDKCAGWSWFSWDELPTPLFAPLEGLRHSGFRPTP